MTDKTELRTFPSDRNEALVMLYLKNQDLSNKSISEIHTMYWEALKEIKIDYHNKRSESYDFKGQYNSQYPKES